MSKFNTHEEDGVSIVEERGFCESIGEVSAEDFINLVASEGKSLRIAKWLGADIDSLVSYTRTPTVYEIYTHNLPPVVPESPERDQATECARRIIDGECELYELNEEASGLSFDVLVKEVI